MARNKNSTFDINEGLFETRVPPKMPDSPVADLTSLFQPTNEHRPLGVTQGRKGQKAKRINMAFSDDVYEYIAYESRRRGVTITRFVNSVIEKYKASPEGHVEF